MPIIDLTPITHVEGNHEVAITASNFINALKLEIQDRFGVDKAEQIIRCGAFVILQESILELIKNSKDAGATRLAIEASQIELFDLNPLYPDSAKEVDIVTGLEIGYVSIAAIDNGTGFDTTATGLYPIHKHELSPSKKTIGSSMGGKNTGNVQASYSLFKNGGGLLRENSHNENGVVCRAILKFISNLAPCVYKIEDYQDEFCAPTKSFGQSSKTMLDGILSGVLAKRTRRAESVASGSLGTSLSPMPNGAINSFSGLPFGSSFNMKGPITRGAPSPEFFVGTPNRELPGTPVHAHWLTPSPLPAASSSIELRSTPSPELLDARTQSITSVTPLHTPLLEDTDAPSALVAGFHRRIK